MPRLVARTLKTKTKKKILSFFREWKFYLRESREISRENLWVPSQLDLPTVNKSPDWVARNIKNPNFEKYFKYFSLLGHWLASEPRKISVWPPATKSPKQDNTVFEIFDIFAKTKDFPKTTNTVKNLFVFDQQGLSIRKYI